jgi:hypothetical protein
MYWGGRGAPTVRFAPVVPWAKAGPVCSGLCDELITRTEESYLLCVSDCVWSRNLNNETAYARVWVFCRTRQHVQKYTSKIIHIIIRRPILTHFHFAYWILSRPYAVIILRKLLAPQNILLRPDDCKIRFRNVSWLINHEHPPQLAHFRLSQLVNAVYNYHYLTLPTPEISAVD